MKSKFTISLSLACILICDGCASTLDKVSSLVTSPKAQVQYVTNNVIETRIETKTNYVQVPSESKTNVVFVERVTTVTNEVSIPHVEQVTNTVYLLKGGIDKGVSIATSGAGFIPPPYGAPVTAGLGVLSAFLAFLVRRKNGENESLTGQLTSVIKGVEQVSQTLPDGNKIKDTISDISKALGVADDLHQSVKGIKLT